VALTGSEPTVAVTLIQESDESFELVGPLLGELRNLAGITVRVEGRLGFGSPRPRCEVSAYELLLVDGQRPWVGVLAARERGTWLVGSETIRLLTPPPDLVSAVDAKVWVLGRRAADGLVVLSYGIIAQPQRR
jgi:hypothetical protein